jgi:hypothetical protein
MPKEHAVRTNHWVSGLLVIASLCLAGGGDRDVFEPEGWLVNPTLASAELYDPFTGVFTTVGGMGTGRAVHTATLLPDGRVLMLGGLTGGASPPYYVGDASAEIYDPATASFASTQSMLEGRFSHTATRLLDGRVLITGGIGTDVVVSSAEIYE